jgi:hypothetical protein
VVIWICNFLVLNLVILDLYCLGVFGYLDLFGFGIWNIYAVIWICNFLVLNLIILDL